MSAPLLAPSTLSSQRSSVAPSVQVRGWREWRRHGGLAGLTMGGAIPSAKVRLDDMARLAA
jgi:hypothetical protein